MNKTKHSVCAICSKHEKMEVIFKKNFNFEKDLNAKIFSARRIPDKVHGTLVKCSKCGLVRTLEIIDKNKLNLLYKESSFTYDSMTKQLIWAYRRVLEKSQQYLSSKNSFLEIGCGNGFMLEEASKFGFKTVFGVEPSVDAVSHAKKNVKKYIKNCPLAKDIFGVSKFDLVCAFQVFDHIPDPNNFLQICHEIINPGGVLILMNHDANSFSAKIFGEKSPIFDIEHTYLYDQITIKKILKKNNFRVKKIYSPESFMTIRYITRLLPLPKTIKNLFSKIKIPFLDKTIKLHSGNLCAIAIKK